MGEENERVYEGGRMEKEQKSGNLRAIQITYNRASDESKTVAMVMAFQTYYGCYKNNTGNNIETTRR